MDNSPVDLFTYFRQLFTLFFVLTSPFLALNMFVSLTDGTERKVQQKVALKIMLTTLITAAIIYFLGEYILLIFAIDVEGFRVGAGVLLMLTAIRLAQGTNKKNHEIPQDPEDIAVVPMSIPTILGPATISAILVEGAKIPSIEHRIVGAAALAVALILLGFILWFASNLRQVLTEGKIKVLSKISGIILSAIAAKMIMTGLRDFTQWGELLKKIGE